MLLKTLNGTMEAGLKLLVGSERRKIYHPLIEIGDVDIIINTERTRNEMKEVGIKATRGCNSIENDGDLKSLLYKAKQLFKMDNIQDAYKGKIKLLLCTWRIQ